MNLEKVVFIIITSISYFVC